jgi:hypothetical protein
VITAGYFTAEARDWAKGKPIELWDIDRIVKLRPTDATAPVVNMAQTPIAEVAEADVRCGQCGSELLVRRNRSTLERLSTDALDTQAAGLLGR